MANPKPSPITDCKLCYPNPCIGGAHRNAMIEDGEIVPNKPITPEEGETVETLAFNLETSTGCIAASGAVKALHDAGYRVAPKPVDYEAEVKKIWPDADWTNIGDSEEANFRYAISSDGNETAMLSDWFPTLEEAWQDAYSKLPAPSTTSEAKKLLVMPNHTYTAALFKVDWEGKEFHIAGTLEGFIDLAIPNGGTYPLSLEGAGRLRDALTSSIKDVTTNCMYERDALLKEGK